MQNQELELTMAKAATSATKHHGLNDQTVEKLSELAEGAGAAGIPFDINLNVPVKGGRGVYESPAYPSIWMTVAGKITINGPEGGVWRVRITDTIAGKVVFDQSGMRKGVPYPAGPYKTGFRAQVRAEAWWSESRDTTLVVNVKGDIG